MNRRDCIMELVVFGRAGVRRRLRGSKVHAKFSQGYIKPSRSRDKPIKQHDSAKAGATWAVSYRSGQRSLAASLFPQSFFLISYYFFP